jgi:hypothetical protein
MTLELRPLSRTLDESVYLGEPLGQIRGTHFSILLEIFGSKMARDLTTSCVRKGKSAQIRKSNLKRDGVFCETWRSKKSEKV